MSTGDFGVTPLHGAELAGTNGGEILTAFLIGVAVGAVIGGCIVILYK